MKHIALFENWKREEKITLTSRQGKEITVEVVNGQIVEIENETGIPFPFFTGQPVTVFMKGWASDHNFKWKVEDPCDPGKFRD
jgi:hypothetical protein